jgi:hypothetical protein
MKNTQLLDRTYHLEDSQDNDLTGTRCRQEVQPDVVVCSGIEAYKKNKGIR